MPTPPDEPLDCDARAVIDRLNALNAPGFETMPPATARTIAAQLLRNAALPRVRVGALRDFELRANGAAVRVRHYRPFGSERETARPALVYFHGGGWTLGDLDTMDHACRTLCRSAGVDVLSVDYPLSPESRCPATVEACAATLREIVAQAGDLGIDPARVGLGGDSAGGNLAAVLTLMARDGELPPVAAQCLVYPALDLSRVLAGGEDRDTWFMRRATMEWFVANYLGDGTPDDWHASPALAPDLSGLPPSLVLTAGHDVLRDEGLAFARRIEAGGGVVELHDFPGQIHNFVAMPHVIPTAHVALAAMAEFLLVHLCRHAGA